MLASAKPDGRQIQEGAIDDPLGIDIAGITADSRQVKPGFLFAAIPGVRQDGRHYIEAAVAAGAIAILAPPGTTVPASGREGPVRKIESANVRRQFALLAARFFRAQPKTVVAVTGTNGKTSTVSITRQLWQRLGFHAASLGTLGIETESGVIAGALTTPDPVALHGRLAELSGQGIDHLALEASSHGLDQYRLDGVHIEAAAFTHLSRDHLDYHADMSAYLAAKTRLFTEVLLPGGVAVLNADSEPYEALRAQCLAAGRRVLSYGHKASDLTLLSVTPDVSALHMKLRLFGQPDEVTLPLVGHFQAWNALAALGLVLADGGDLQAALAALTKLNGIPGRMQRIDAPDGNARPFAVYVDYAHTPDSLATALQALRPHVAGRLVVVFGCGGDRDAGKRPLMGQAAADNADVVYVTDDNPRSEEAAKIRRQALVGCPQGYEIGDRRQAIVQAISQLRAGDVLLVAGKGHERGQIVGDRVVPFDDAEEVGQALLATPASGGQA